LEFAVANIGETFAKLQAAEQALNANWPAAIAKPQFWSGCFSMRSITGRLEQAFKYAGHGSVARLKEFAAIGSDESLSQTVSRQLAASLDELKLVELHVPDMDDDESDEVAVAPPASERVRGFAAMIG
jgi:hypothetical protein